MKILFICAAKTRTKLLINASIRGGLSLILYWCILALPIILLKQFRVLNFNTAVLPLILACILVGNIAYQIAGEKTQRHYIALLDNAAGLKARLISAWDQMEKGWDSKYSELVKQDAEESASRLDIKKLFPLSFPKFTAITPFLFAICISLLIFQIPVHWFRNIDPKIASQASSLEEMARRLVQEDKDTPDPGNLRLAEEMERLASEFRDLPMTKSEAREKLESLAEEMEKAGRDFRRKNFQNSDTPPGIMNEAEQTLEMMDQDMLDQKDINDLERKLMESPDIRPGIKENLKEKFDEFEKNPNPDAQKDLADDIRDQLDEEESGESENNPYNENSDQLTKMSSEIGDNNDSAAAPGADGNQEGEGSSARGTGENNSGSSTTPGKTDSKDTATNFETENPETVEQLAPDDRIANENTVQSQVKNLPKINKKKIVAADVDLNYKKAIESNILKEEIPLSMREYIKDYFIGIGVLNEDETGEE